MVLNACGASDNGTYVYKGDLPFITELTATLTIDGDKGTIDMKGKALGLAESEDTIELSVNQKDKKIKASIEGDDSSEWTYAIDNGKLTITEDNIGLFTDVVFEKQ